VACVCMRIGVNGRHEQGKKTYMFGDGTAALPVAMWQADLHAPARCLRVRPVRCCLLWWHGRPWNMEWLKSRSDGVTASCWAEHKKVSHKWPINVSMYKQRT
jgi:hypothetical protein